MRIAVDIRPLITQEFTGVQEYTFNLLSAVFLLHSQNEYYLFHNGKSLVPSACASWQLPNVHFIKSPLPKKLLTALEIACKQPKLDSLIAKSLKLPAMDIFFSPHLNFTSLSPTTKHVLTIHDLTFELFPEFFTTKRRLWHHLARPKEQCEEAAHIITPSENTKRDIIEHFGVNAEKITVSYPALSNTSVSQEFITQTIKKYSLPDNYILFIGTIEPRKNVMGLIEAFEQVASTNVSLVIAGANGWNNEAIFKRIQASPKKDRIRYLGYVTQEEKIVLYKHAKVFVYPSFYEGFGFPVLEAMAQGVPTITSNRSSLPEVVGDAGYLVNPHKPNEITAGLKLLLSNTELREAQIKKGLQRAKQFSWEKCAREWLVIMQ